MLQKFSTNCSGSRTIEKNELVAFPTETVYGLGANAKSDEAVAKIYSAKGRPSDNPLIIHIAKKEQLTEIVDSYPDWIDPLIDRFWPGPLTLVLPKRRSVESCHSRIINSSSAHAGSPCSISINRSSKSADCSSERKSFRKAKSHFC